MLRFVFTFAFPIAITILPQFGSSPAIAVFTNGEFAIEKPIFFASFSFLHFSTLIVTNLEAPSPSAATLLAKFFKTKEDVFDPIFQTNYKELWHRGFPIEKIDSRERLKFINKKVIVDVQADFWNGDPDIDAICRMEHHPNCKFKDKYFPLASNKVSPFNSQNTFISKKVLPHYFLFPHIGRMDDIWASFYVISKGFKVVYNKASVFQKRNQHDLTKDMLKEFIGYENNLRLIKDLKINVNKINSYIPKRSRLAFLRYQTHFK